jgi:16S rRNA (guanine966-N2)-methyltransferase
MRIIGGTAGRRVLKVPKGLTVRPTPDLVRQAIFNSLADRVIDAAVLELFAGTGAFALECLSRGAASAICVELSSKHAGFVHRNLEAVGLDRASLQVRVQDAYAAIHQLAAEGAQFDLVFADPPYGEKNIGRRSRSDAQQLLDEQSLPRLVAPGGLFILGHARRDSLDIDPGLWEERKTLKHGDSLMRFLVPTHRQPPTPSPSHLRGEGARLIRPGSRTKAEGG